MITFICEVKECRNNSVEYNFLGNPKTAECGGCKATLEGKNHRPDPEMPTVFWGANNQETLDSPEMTLEPEEE